MYPNMVYNMAARTHDFFANLGHFQGITIAYRIIKDSKFEISFEHKHFLNKFLNVKLN